MRGLALLVPLLAPSALAPQPWPEISPPVGARTYITTDHSYRATWVDGKLLVRDRTPVTARDPRVLWRRNYAGVYDALRVRGHELLFVHGENKNEIIDGHAWKNTVNGHATCWSGVQSDGVYRDCWADYYGFASITVDGRDLGPIVWPRDGYLNAHGAHASNGVRHPTAIRAGRWLYAFYADSSPSIAGVAVARAPTRSLGRPGAWRTWTGRKWARSLPYEHNFQHPGSSLRARGPATRAVIPGAGWFAVTRTSPGRYLGLSYGWLPDGQFGTLEWASRDLIRWRRLGSPIWTAADYDSTTVRYARPVSATRVIATTGAQVELLPIPR